MLIIVCGLPGSGKSSLSRSLKKVFSAVYLNSDVIRKQIFSSPAYTEDEKRRVYFEMANQAEKILAGRNVIVDATFYKKRYREIMKEAARDAGTRYIIIECTLPEDVIRSRLAKRMEFRKGVSDAGYDVYLEMKGNFDPIDERHLTVDCSLPMEERVKIIRKFLGEKGG